MFSKHHLVAAIALFPLIGPTRAEFAQQPFTKTQVASLPIIIRVLDRNGGIRTANNTPPAAASADHHLQAEDQVAATNSPPTLESWDHLTGTIRLHFANAASGLALKYQPGAFEIAGADQKWYPADAHAFGDIVIVSTSLVQNPVAVRYDWRPDSPAILFNQGGLPVARFRTDDWSGGQDGVSLHERALHSHSIAMESDSAAE